MKLKNDSCSPSMFRKIGRHIEQKITHHENCRSQKSKEIKKKIGAIENLLNLTFRYW